MEGAKTNEGYPNLCFYRSTQKVWDSFKPATITRFHD